MNIKCKVVWKQRPGRITKDSGLYRGRIREVFTVYLPNTNIRMLFKTPYDLLYHFQLHNNNLKHSPSEKQDY